VQVDRPEARLRNSSGYLRVLWLLLLLPALINFSFHALFTDEENNWAPGLSERYHNFLESILRIVVSLLVALPQNLAVAGKVRLSCCQ
jgi:hypothetical protein